MTEALSARTLYDKIWDEHIVAQCDDGTCLIYVDRHLIQETTCAQAFEGLRIAGRPLRRPELTLAVADHNVPTTPRIVSGVRVPVSDPDSARQLAALVSNTSSFGVEYIDDIAPEQGIVHVIGPEQGFTLPGAVLACGDSHTGSHGALGALGLGIGTSEVEHVFASQTLRLRKAKNFEVRVEGFLGRGITAKDVALAVVKTLGAAGAMGHVIEYTGAVIRSMSIEGRLTLCNMSIEAGARAGLIAPDDVTFAYVRGRPRTPSGAMWDRAVAHWRSLRSDPDAVYDRRAWIDGATIPPLVTWGTCPEDVIAITDEVPDPTAIEDPGRRAAAERSLAYMGLTPGQRMQDVAVDRIFIGSCTNSRIEDLRAAATVVRGHRIAPSIKQALVVPGSGLVKRQAEAEGLDRIFLEAGFEWREPGCSMCLGMNPDKVPPGERCASTSNRNFVGRQGPNARTHLLSPAMAAAAAIKGHFADVREMGP